MKFTFLIPVYISRKTKDGWKKGDTVYDHPTPIDQKGTLVRTLESFESLKSEEFNIMLVVSAVAPQLEKKTTEWIKKIIKEARYLPKNIFIITHKHLDGIRKNLTVEDRKKFSDLLSLKGYSQNRNIGLISGLMLGTDVVIWLDDDELVKDRDFLKKLREGFTHKVGGKETLLITGACPEGETGSYIRIREMKPWMEYWNKIKQQNEGFKKIIGTAPRWKVSPFAHGGLSAIHRQVFTKIPYDPNVGRGEDMDYNINTRMFGYEFFLDNTLEIRHCPLPRSHPQWRRVREDLLRYLWQRNKIRQQAPVPGMVKVTAEEFDPYPGYFMKDNLEELAEKSQRMLAEEYRTEGKIKDVNEALKNIKLAHKWPLMKKDAFQEYLKLQKLWMELTAKIEKMGKKFYEKL